MSALRPYEMLIIVDPRPTDEEVAALLTQLGEQLKTLGADVAKMENWGSAGWRTTSASSGKARTRSSRFLPSHPW